MKAYDARSTIGAAPEVVWAILTDAPGYSKWDSGVEKVEGRVAPGEKITVVSKANPGRAFPMPDLGPSFKQFATGLKTRAENGA